MSVLPPRQPEMDPDSIDLRSTGVQWLTLPSTIPRVATTPKPIPLEPVMRREDLMTDIAKVITAPVITAIPLSSSGQISRVGQVEKKKTVEAILTSRR